MTPDPTRFTIGQLARRTGLPVRTIRFWSDSGVVPEVDRTEAGYRLYDVESLARLELVQTLRELGLGLATIRSVLARERTLAEVAAAHAAAVDAQIRTLRLRRAVLRAVASTDRDHQEIQLMTRLATQSDSERRRIVEAFVEETFAGVGGGEVRDRMLAVGPQLPDDPTPAQVQAWVELSELVQDPAFRAVARGMAQRAHDDGAERDGVSANPAVAKVVGERAGGAVAAGIAPDAPEAAPVLEAILAAMGEPDDRRALADRIDAFADARVERYWELLGTINGWPPRPRVVPAWTWLAAALRAGAVR